MKKSEWQKLAASRWVDLRRAEGRASALRSQVAELQREIDDKRKNWAPIPIAHRWVPRDPSCIYCDDPREALRHNVE